MDRHELARRRVIRRCRKIIRDSTQLLRETRHWNRVHADSMPFDCGADLVRIHLARRILTQAEANIPIDDQLFKRLMETVDG